MTNKEIINTLKRLDLSTYPYDEVMRLVSMFQPKFLRITLPQGCIIERIRPDINVYERQEVSYRPADKNTRPQRATLPGKTAFYGTMCHVEESLMNTRYIALLEASRLVKQGLTANGEEHYTLSRWITSQPIKLAVFVHDSVFKEAVHNRLLVVAKQKWDNGKTFIDDEFQAEEYSRYVTSQFSKPVTEDYEYIITATIAEMLMYASRCDGVMYPSVQAEGDYGMNVALRPDVADTKLRLADVREMKYVQKNGNGNLGFTKQCVPVEMDERGIKKWGYK